MRKYVEKDNIYSEFFVGKTEEIRAIYKSIARNKNTRITPAFPEFPRFSENKQVYVIHVDMIGWMTLLTSDDFALMLLEGKLTEVPRKEGQMFKEEVKEILNLVFEVESKTDISISYDYHTKGKMLGITGEGRVFIASEKSCTEERLDEIKCFLRNLITLRRRHND